MSSFELPPGWRDAMKRLSEFVSSPEYRAASERLNEVVAGSQRRIAEAIAPALEQWRLQLPTAQDWLKRYGPQLSEIAERAQVLWRQSLPANWVDLEMDDVFLVIDRVRATGFSLVWAPRVEIVREVLAVPAAQTGAVLVSRSSDVLDDLVAELAAVDHPELALHRDAASEAIDTYRDGRHRAAQALASSVFTSEVHLWFEMGTSAARKRLADEHPEDAFIDQIRLRTIYLAGAKALDEFRPDRARPVRPEFNRHNTAHRITFEQWNERNALCALLLAVTFLRELNYWFHQGSRPA